MHAKVPGGAAARAAAVVPWGTAWGLQAGVLQRPMEGSLQQLRAEEQERGAGWAVYQLDPPQLGLLICASIVACYLQPFLEEAAS